MSLAIYLVGVLAVVAVMLSSYFLGERSHDPFKNQPYEAGIESFGSPRIRYFTQYFLLAALFVIFDIESVFLYLWSSTIREVGWQGFFQVSFFVGILLLSLLYAFRAGALDLVAKVSKRERHEHR